MMPVKETAQESPQYKAFCRESDRIFMRNVMTAGILFLLATLITFFSFL